MCGFMLMRICTMSKRVKTSPRYCDRITKINISVIEFDKLISTDKFQFTENAS